MISDAQNQLSRAQALSGAGAVNSTNVIDLTQTTRDVGNGSPLVVCITVDVALAGTAPTFLAALVVSAAAGLTSPTILAQSQAFNALAAGSRFYVAMPRGFGALEYVGVIYTLGGTTPSITVTANLEPGSFGQAETYGASGFSLQ